MAQPDIISVWKKYTGLIGNDINRQFGYGSHLLNIVRAQRKQWAEESGHVQMHVQYNRAGITADAQAEYTDADGAAWPEAIKSSGVANYGGASSGDQYDNKNNVDPPTDELKFSYDERGYGIEQKAYNTQDFSAEDLRAAARSSSQTNQIVKILADTSKEYFVRMFRDQFSRVAGNRFIVTGSSANPTFVENSDINECFDAVTAARWTELGYSNGTYDVAGSIDEPNFENISEITWGHLEDLYLRLCEDGGENYSMGMSDGKPVFTLVTDLLTQRRLLTEGSAGKDVRTDIRESSMVDDLLKPMGVTTSMNGWVILSEWGTRRFDVTGDASTADTGAWTERLFYENNAAKDKRTIASAYRSATCAESYVMAPAALSNFVLRPNYAGTGSMTFKPQNYAGEYDFKVIIEKDRNVDGAHGFFRAKLASGMVADDPNLLYVLRHLKGTGTQSA